MKAFMVRYLIIAVIGTALILGLAPYLRRDARPAALDGVERLIAANASLSACAGFIRNHLLWKGDVQRISFSGDQGEGDSVTYVTRVVKRPPTPGANNASPRTGDPAATSRPQQPTQVQAVASDETWGLVAVPKARVYDQRGKALNAANTGEAFRLHDTLSTSAGRCALLSRANATAPGQRFLIKESDLLIVTHPLSRLSPGQRQLWVQKAQALAQISDLKSSKAKGDRTDNPHYRAYTTAKRNYAKYIKTARDLQKDLDRTSGAANVAIYDKLRSHKHKEMAVQQAYKSAKKQFDSWNRSHPRNTGEIDRKIALLQQKIATLDSRIATMDFAK